MTEKSYKYPYRRRLLISVVAGGGAAMTARYLPETWINPVVNTVMLPAHAQTSRPPPPISTEPDEGCGLFACLEGDDAFGVIQVTNLSGSDLTLTNVELSNPNHSLALPALPLVVSAGTCEPLVVSDDSEECGVEMSDGVATLFFDGFSPVDVDLPVLAIGP